MPLDQIDVDKIGIPEKEMSFLDHLEELRWHIIRSLIAVGVIGILLFIFYRFIFDHVIFGPAHEDFITYRLICRASEALCFTPPPIPTQAIGFGESFIMTIKTSFIIGIIVAFPYIFWEFWRFISPGLYDKERNATRGIVIICSLLFFMGVLFGYFIIAPFAVNFLMGFTIPGVQNTPTLSSFLNYMIMFTAPAGLIFELPIVVYFLSKIGLVTPAFMRKYRRHSFIGILLLAAIVTPPDVVTQFLIGIPLYILYEISIIISARVNKRAEAQNA
ncbi:MAG: twin-arginine translocase subunit TatC [Bacteroidetes bacterium]|nr:twin-arginine translocase subunit TatC [Bacteroidota bacterium]